MDNNVRSYDDTTLFCPAGMQQFKSLFLNKDHVGTQTNIQSCIRLNDIEEIGDGSHLLYFNMIGLFSFRQLSVSQTIDFWMEFLNKINLHPDYVTIHSDKLEWKDFYNKWNVDVRIDDGCIWSDGTISSYCTEFYKDDIEIGNIVNPLGTSIDAGFGLERIEMVLYNERKSREECLRETIFKIIESGFTPTYNKQGSLLRKLLRICYLEGIIIDHEFYRTEIIRQEKIIEKYKRMKNNPKFQNKDRNFWFSTLGLDIDLINGII